MSNRKTLLFLVAAAIALVVGYAAFRTAHTPTTSPVAVHAISKAEMRRVVSEANSGNCAAADRLARYHMNITLQYNSAVQWARIAAKCPAAEYKETLFILLAPQTGDADIVDEVNRLLAEIKVLDSSRSAHLERALANLRKK